MDTQHATHTRDETQANDFSKADAFEPGQTIKPAASAGDQFDDDAYKAAIKAAEDFSKSESFNYKFHVSLRNSQAVIEALPFVRKVKVVSKVNGVKKVKTVLKHWAPTYKAKGRTFNDKEAAWVVGLNYGAMLMAALRQGANEISVQRVIREAYTAFNAQRSHHQSSVVSGFICKIENKTFDGMRSPKVIF